MQDRCRDIIPTGGGTFTLQMGWFLAMRKTESKYHQQYPVIMCAPLSQGENWQGRVDSIYMELPETEATSSLGGSKKLELS